MTTIKNGGRPRVASRIEATAWASPPDFFRLPSIGGDPHFGFTRSFYYNGEERGWWKLVRIRNEGKERGVTLVPYAAVLAFVRAQAEGGAK